MSDADIADEARILAEVDVLLDSQLAPRDPQVKQPVPLLAEGNEEDE